MLYCVGWVVVICRQCSIIISNSFISYSHNMDQTETFMQEATEFFVTENLPRFLRGEDLLNPVDPAAGY